MPESRARPEARPLSATRTAGPPPWRATASAAACGAAALWPVAITSCGYQGSVQPGDRGHAGTAGLAAARPVRAGLAVGLRGVNTDLGFLFRHVAYH